MTGNGGIIGGTRFIDLPCHLSQVTDDANVMLNGFGTVVNSLGKRAKPYLSQICGTIKWRLNNKAAKIRQQAADLIARIAPVMKTCEEEQLLGHLGEGGTMIPVDSGGKVCYCYCLPSLMLQWPKGTFLYSLHPALTSLQVLCCTSTWVRSTPKCLGPSWERSSPSSMSLE